MDTATIRQQLHDYLDIADEKKIKAIYTMVEDEINVEHVEYTDELKAELDRRVEYYLNGGKMVTPEEMRLRLKSVREKKK